MYVADSRETLISVKMRSLYNTYARCGVNTSYVL